MIKYIIGRLLWIIPVLFVVTVHHVRAHARGARRPVGT